MGFTFRSLGSRINRLWCQRQGCSAGLRRDLDSQCRLYRRLFTDKNWTPVKQSVASKGNTLAQCQSTIRLYCTIQPASWNTTPCPLFATGYLIYPQLSSTCGDRLLHPQPKDESCRRDKGRTYGVLFINRKNCAAYMERKLSLSV